jgi:hypothetical protein
VSRAELERRRGEPGRNGRSTSEGGASTRRRQQLETVRDAAHGAALGAALGAMLGAAAGATAGALLATRGRSGADSELVSEGARAAGREVATAAALAARDVLASKALSQLLPSNRRGDRAEALKDAARESALAAAVAAREVLAARVTGGDKDRSDKDRSGGAKKGTGSDS